MNLSKHRKQGKSVNTTHFTGKKGGKRRRRRGLTHKQRKLNKTHTNKFKED